MIQSPVINTETQNLSLTNKDNLLNKNTQTHLAFKGGIADTSTKVLGTCVAYPMLYVTLIDCVTAIIPRTLFDAKTNIFAALETFRRESSGLIVNCLAPSFIVLAVAKLAEPFFNKSFSKLKMSSVWANEDSINTLSEYYKKAKGNTKEEKLRNYVKNVIKDLSGTDSKEEIKFSDKKFNFDKNIDEISKAISDTKVSTKKASKEAYKNIVEQTKAAEILKLNGKSINSNLSELLNNVIELGRRFNTDGVAGNMEQFKLNSRKLINAKSLLGLGIIIPLAMSVQKINRWITEQTSGQKGAPIYKDFAKDKNTASENNHDKDNLLRNKIIAIGGMLGVVIASMTKIPTMGMLQFKGMFPTVDQCRLISAATFSSRLAVAEDNNELKEAFIRDVVTFASLYWLGDYASKLAAMGFEKSNPEIKLLNHSKILDTNAPIYKKVFNWIKNVQLKSFDEVTAKAKNARTFSQLVGFAFSTIVLGLLLPKYTRMQTEKKEAEYRQKMNMENSTIKEREYKQRTNMESSTIKKRNTDFHKNKNFETANLHTAV